MVNQVIGTDGKSVMIDRVLGTSEIRQIIGGPYYLINVQEGLRMASSSVVGPIVNQVASRKAGRVVYGVAIFIRLT